MTASSSFPRTVTGPFSVGAMTSATVICATVIWAAVIWSAVTWSKGAWAADPARSGTALPLRRDAADRYQNFIVNWDPTAPVLCGVVRGPADYAQVFHPAPVIGGRKPFAPPDESFAEETLLVVARVVPGGVAHTLVIDTVEASGGDLVVHCRFQPGAGASTFMVKQAALAWIPRVTAPRVRFLENGTLRATLDLAAGSWIVPAIPAPAP
jgi:hypothetical protein